MDDVLSCCALQVFVVRCVLVGVVVVVCWLLFVVRWRRLFFLVVDRCRKVLPVVCYGSLSVVCCSALVGSCVLLYVGFAVRCSLCVACCCLVLLFAGSCCGLLLFVVSWWWSLLLVVRCGGLVCGVWSSLLLISVCVFFGVLGWRLLWRVDVSLVPLFVDGCLVFVVCCLLLLMVDFCSCASSVVRQYALLRDDVRLACLVCWWYVLLCDVSSSLFVVRCLLFVVCRLLCVVRCVLCVVCCSLCVVGCVLFVVCCVFVLVACWKSTVVSVGCLLRVVV